MKKNWKSHRASDWKNLFAETYGELIHLGLWAIVLAVAVWLLVRFVDQ